MEYKYKAFISYKHGKRDSLVAEELQNILEEYIIPKDCRTGEQKTLGRIFRDEKDLPYTDDLPRQIKNALDASEFLIVICSPETSKSAYVSKEISYFLENHGEKRVVPVLSFGDPKVVFGEVLPMLEEPFGMELNGFSDGNIRQGIKKLLSKLCAPLLGMEPDDLVRRELLWKQKRSTIGWSIALTIVMVIGCILWWSNRQIDGKNEELQKTNWELQQQINERLLRESELLTQSSVQALADGDQYGAIRYAVEALPATDSPRPYYAPAEQALYSALNLFGTGQSEMVLRDTVFELPSAADKICASADGTLLMIECGGMLKCFDIATGEEVWSRNISVEQFYSSEHFNGIIVCSSGTLTNIQQNTGEILWKISIENSADLIEFSDDGCYAVCLKKDSCFGGTVLFQISLEDGSIVQTIPLNDDYNGVGMYHTDAYDFSSDGRYFAGCCYKDDEEALVFEADLTTGVISVVCNIQTPNNMIPCSVEYTDNDTNLMIVQYTDGYNFKYRVSKHRISDGRVIWQTDTPVEKEIEYYAHYMKYLDWVYLDQYLLLGVRHKLYLLNMITGALMDNRHLNGEMICLEQLGDDTFSLIRSDGTYTTGHASDEGVKLHTNMAYMYDPVSVMDLGDVWDAYMINGGYLRVRESWDMLPVMIDNENQIPCSVAIVKQEYDAEVILRQVVPMKSFLDAKVLHTYEAEIDNIPDIRVIQKDTLAVYEDKWGWEIKGYLDRSTLEKKEISDEIDIDYNDDRFDEEANVNIYHLWKGQSTPLGSIGDKVRMSFGNRYVDSAVLDCYMVNLASDNTVASIVLSAHGIRVWIDDQQLPDIRFPEELGTIREADYQAYFLSPDENGYVKLEYNNFDREYPLKNYYYYSIRDEKWYSIPCDSEIWSYSCSCLGMNEPTITVMTDTGAIHTYDMQSGKLIRQINTELLTGNIRDMRWIMNDRYLVVQKEYIKIFVLDGQTGEIVFSHIATMINHVTHEMYPVIYEPIYAADPSGKKLYIWDDEGICVDTESWTKLVDIPHMVGYDPVSDMVFTFDAYTTQEDLTKHITAVQIPTTEELVELAQEFLGN